MALCAINGEEAFLDRSGMFRLKRSGNVLVRRDLGEQLQLKFKQGKLREGRKVQVVSAQKDIAKRRRFYPNPKGLPIVPVNPFHPSGVTHIDRFEDTDVSLTALYSDWKKFTDAVGTLQGETNGKWVVRVPYSSVLGRGTNLVLCDRKDLFVMPPAAGEIDARHVSRTTIKVKVGGRNFLHRPATDAIKSVIPAVYNTGKRVLTGTRLTRTLHEAFQLSVKRSSSWTETRLKFPTDLWCEDRNEHVHIERGAVLEKVNSPPWTAEQVHSESIFKEGDIVTLTFAERSLYKDADVRLVPYQKDLDTFSKFNNLGVTVWVKDLFRG
jgi:hypothetical protein